MMLKGCSAVSLLSALLTTAASAQIIVPCSGVGQELASAYQQWQSAPSEYSETEKEYSRCAESQPRDECKDKYSELARSDKFSEAEKEYSSCVVRRASSAKATIRKSNLRSGLWNPPSQNTRAGDRTIVFSSLEPPSEGSDRWVYGL
jgi:hypothetical protein